MILIKVAQNKTIHFLTEYIILVNRDVLFDILKAQVFLIQVAQHQIIHFITEYLIFDYKDDLMDI